MCFIDDTFIYFDNLIKFFARKNPEIPTVHGHLSNLTKEEVWKLPIEYAIGGPGYYMSRAAFRTLGQQLVRNFSYCPNTGVEGNIFNPIWYDKICSLGS